jgi:hypothetical protein
MTDQEKIIELQDKVISLKSKLAEVNNCPFCKQEDFDLIGLKYHLLTHCQAFDETEY